MGRVAESFSIDLSMYSSMSSHLRSMGSCILYLVVKGQVGYKQVLR
jgi:hypothetical protein